MCKIHRNGRSDLEDLVLPIHPLRGGGEGMALKNLKGAMPFLCISVMILPPQNGNGPLFLILSEYQFDAADTSIHVDIDRNIGLSKSIIGVDLASLLKSLGVNRADSSVNPRPDTDVFR